MLFQNNNKISQREIYLLVSMCLSHIFSNGKVVEYFYFYGEALYQSLVSESGRVAGITLKVLCKVISMNIKLDIWFKQSLGC